MSDSTWYSRDSEAESLAAQLRTQRLTLLFGAPGSGKTTLLTAGVLPLLHRRATDELSGIAEAGGVVLPFPDRRSADEGPMSGHGALEADSEHGALQGGRHLEPDAEVAVFFDTWDQAPLDGLLDRMREALSFPIFDGTQRRRSLASTLGSFHRQRGGKSLIVLDRFEEFLVMPENSAGARQFGDALVDAMNRPGLPVHFLIALNEEAAPLLERFRGRIAGLDDHCMRLPPLRKSEATPSIPVLRQVPDGYRPPIDLELPSRSTPPSIQPDPHEPVLPPREIGLGTLNTGSPSTEYASSRQPSWVDTAFAHPSSSMKTQDVYASMEALLGKIAQGGKEPEAAAESGAGRRRASSSISTGIVGPGRRPAASPAVH